MAILQGVIFIEVDINTRKITFLRTDTVNDYDKNTTNIYVQAIYRNSDGDKTYLSSEDIKNYVFTLYTLKPGTNNPFTINGVVTTELKEQVRGGVVKFVIPKSCTNRAGVVKCELHVTKAEERIASTRFIFNVEKSLVTTFNEALLEDSDFSVLQQLILEIQKASNIDDNNRSKITSYSSDKVETIKEELSSQIKDIKNRICICPEDFGAKGDGVTDDYEAFKKMSEFCKNKSDIKISMSGTYYIDKIGTNPYQDNIVFENITGLEIKGNGSLIKCNGNYVATKDWSSGNYYFSNNHSIALVFIECKYVSVSGLYIDGGSKNTTNDGTTATNIMNGLQILHCEYFNMENCNISHYNCDALVVAENIFSNYTNTENGNSKNITFNNCIISNGVRNSLTIGACENVLFLNCVIKQGGMGEGGFNTQSPGIALDIEPDFIFGDGTRNIKFDSCEFSDSACGLIAVSGNGVKDVLFTNCLMTDTNTNGSYSISAYGDNIVFSNNIITIKKAIQCITNYPNKVEKIVYKNNIIKAYNISAFILGKNYLHSTSDYQIVDNIIEIIESDNVETVPIYIEAPVKFNNNKISIKNSDAKRLYIIRYVRECTNNYFYNVNILSVSGTIINNNFINSELTLHNPRFNGLIINSAIKGSYGDQGSVELLTYNSYVWDANGVFVNKLIKAGTFLFNSNKNSDINILRCTADGYYPVKSDWTSNTEYTNGVYVKSNNKIYKSSNSGTSGDIAPTEKSDFQDNDILWTYIGDCGTFKKII